MDTQRLLLFVALSFVLLLLWQAWEQDYGSHPSPETTQQPAPAPERETTSPPPAAGEVPQPPQTQSESAAAPAAAAAEALPAGKLITVETDLLKVKISTLGGDLREADLLRYPVSVNEPDSPFRLLNTTPDNFFIAQSGLLGATAAPNHYAEFHAEQSTYRLPAGAEELKVPLHWSDPSGVEVTKVYTFRRNSYLVKLSYEVRNGSAQPWEGRLYSQFQRAEPHKSKTTFIYTYTGAVISTPDNHYEKVNFKDMRENNVSLELKDGWVAMLQHYFVAAWIPPQSQTEHAYSKVLQNGRFILGIMGPTTSVAPGGQGSLSAELYAGPKEQDRLKAAAPNLVLTVDYGYLTVLAEPIYWLLEVIHDIIGNWGWSIVLLTLLIKLAFFHLSATSYKSMANMRKLQPRLQALKERYGDDRQKMNQAMMEMYKKEKINPLGGCLPILVQIPVFIALYWVLLESVELRQAPWILWIKDLSTKDPYYVLPIIMGITMVAQQRLNPAPLDPVQAKVMMVLPIVFTVFFAFFPSGLVLYWVVNNTLSIAQQWVITRKLVKA